MRIAQRAGWHIPDSGRVLVWVSLVLAGVTCGPLARATIVERVVAVIGERALLWTDLIHRATPSRIQIRMQTHDPNMISAQEQEMYKEVLDRMIDDRLEEQQADKAHISVSTDEIDRAIENIISQAQATQGRAVTQQDVLSEIHRRGMSEQEFRDELRRQILEGKLLELRVRPRVRVTEQDARSTYQRFAQETREQQSVEVRILALRVQRGADSEEFRARMALADEIVRRARSGADFCAIVQQYSDDSATRAACGSRGPQAFATLLPEIQGAVLAGKPGEVSDPVTVHFGQQEEAIVVVMPLGAAKVPPFEEVKNEMTQRALVDALERGRKQWLQELRHKVYIDVRL
ncbi:MAG: SurA N-terminal domain-containing protein [Polyangiaceae bacterium]|jgi:peptidyl-prolyl cis-trans isomerase SurA